MNTGRTADRITIGLITATREALDYLTARTGLSNTDTIGRSLQLHAMVQRELDEGAELLIRRPNKKLERVHLLA